MISTGRKMTLAYFTPSRSAALEYTSGGGRRSRLRMAMSASSCASQSIAFRVKTTFGVARGGERWETNADLPTTATRPLGAVLSFAAGEEVAARMRVLRSTGGNSLV